MITLQIARPLAEIKSYQINVPRTAQMLQAKEGPAEGSRKLLLLCPMLPYLSLLPALWKSLACGGGVKYTIEMISFYIQDYTH